MHQSLEKDDHIIYVIRPIDKKQILFYNDKSAQMPIDEELQKLWRSVAVDGIDDNKIEEYLDVEEVRHSFHAGHKCEGIAEIETAQGRYQEENV